MIFTSLKFLVFFVAVFLVYYVVPKKWQWLVLLVASTYFYMCASVKYAVFLVGATLITYLGALILDKIEAKQANYLQKENLSKEDKKAYKTKVEKKKKIVITGTIVGTLSMLLVMKYTGFVLENISALANVLALDFTAPAWNLILPLRDFVLYVHEPWLCN